ncbi:MAG TPA: GNAT family N-acetyltransferase [Gaiellales bacterium]|nr:GNAT family N-acetyltransferase [Gaiellales bacterium]
MGEDPGESRVVLNRLEVDEFDAWLPESTEWYASDMIRHALMSEQDAREKASRDMAFLLAEGVDTPQHTIAHVVDAATGERLGWVWYRRVERASGPVVYVYQIEIAEPHRGRGLGRAAMLEVERAARATGASGVELNVFAGNSVARALYRSLGFGEVSIGMAKPLT